MSMLKSISGKVMVLVAIVFSMMYYNKVKDSVENQPNCLCAFDGFGYYMYLPHFFQHGNLNMTHEWAQNLQNEYCHGQYAYQLEHRDNGNFVDIYHMGLSILSLPSYAIGDVFATIGGYERNGFTTPYIISYHLNALLFLFLGLLYLRKLLLLFVKDHIAAIALIIAYFGTNVYITFSIQYDLPHLYLFTLNAISLYHLIRYTRTEQRKILIYSALVFGLTVCIRPTQAIFGIIPFFVLINHLGNTKKFWKYIMFFPLAALIWNIPQFIYWKTVGGELVILNLHTEDIVLTDPNFFNFLFSYRKGWLLYTPIFLLLPFYIFALYKKHKPLFWGISIFTFLYIYVMCSWECWWYASSFSSRVMVDIYPVLILAAAIFIDQLKRNVLRVSFGIFAIAFIGLNIFQSVQLERGLITGDRMTKQHYWYVFGKLNIPDYNRKLLLIDQFDLKWPEYAKEMPEHFSIETREIFRIDQPMKATPHEPLAIGRLRLFEAISTHETQYEVHMTAKTSDSLHSSIVKFETVSRYNCYGWDNTEISQGFDQEGYVKHVFKFNSPWIRHKADEMQIYIWNPNDVTIDLKDLKIIAHSLIRK